MDMAHDVKSLSQKIDNVSAKIDRNQKSLDKLDSVSKKINDVSVKIDRNQKALDQIDDVARILRENEQNLKDLGTLKNRLDLLDKIYIKIDKIAGEVTAYREQQELNSARLAGHEDRIEKVEKHLHLSTTS
ncbi:hypothetical protein A3A63_02890 [Candidatus Gottesmanbacteria bacterium RIFCSPLOWO2_01_FULL_46_9]|uniref:t-SNARE coiled-coil homology domain-containing protein n=1 Tax=Candidatus Gottesmanbacteria bacterium RIFCSPLOWO2_01_FULL_46_9 TaxID=1798394 RepID=A0A1F6B0S9_9BACT|nr:MAG: hypothetical protein A3A63_02890 [Candidatus Gottesmanbacteria bacterium RIFCSPLOWO2_01_FULL_46_9]